MWKECLQLVSRRGSAGSGGGAFALPLLGGLVAACEAFAGALGPVANLHNQSLH